MRPLKSLRRNALYYVRLKSYVSYKGFSLHYKQRISFVLETKFFRNVTKDCLVCNTKKIPVQLTNNCFVLRILEILPNTKHFLCKVLTEFRNAHLTLKTCKSISFSLVRLGGGVMTVMRSSYVFSCFPLPPQ